MFGLVSVTPRATQRALAGDLDGQHRMMAAQNAAPAAENISFFHCEPLLPLVGVEDLRIADCGLRSLTTAEHRRAQSKTLSDLCALRWLNSSVRVKPELSPLCCRSSREAPV